MHFGEQFVIVGVYVVARAAQERTTLGRVEFRDLAEQWVQMYVGHSWIEQAVKALDEAKYLDFELICPHHSAINGRVEGWSIAAGSQDSDTLHGCHSHVKRFDGAAVASFQKELTRVTKRGAVVRSVSIRAPHILYRQPPGSDGGGTRDCEKVMLTATYVRPTS